MRDDEYQSSRCIPLPVARDRRHRDRVARVRVAADEVARVGQHEVPGRRVDVRALGVDDLRAHRERRGLAALRQADRLVRVEQPRVEQIEVRRVSLQRVRVRQSRGIVLGGEARDVVRRLHRLPDRRPREVGRRRVAAPLADVHGDGQSLVAGALDRLHLPAAHGDRQPGRLAGLARRIARAQRAGVLQRVLREVGEAVVGDREDGHGVAGVACEEGRGAEVRRPRCGDGGRYHKQR